MKAKTENMFHLLENPLSRDYWFKDLLLGLPLIVLKLMTWSVLAIEIAFAPACLLAITRKWAWTLMIAMHLGILMVIDFADLTIGMLMIHLLTFDARWLAAKSTKGSVIFFDGVCGLCNGFIDFVLEIDTSSVHKFATLQGDVAKSRLPKESVEDLNTIVLINDGKTYTQSGAVSKVLRNIGGIWTVLGTLLWLIPKPLRNFGYHVVAQNRYQWFGKRDTCRMPTPEERAKFFD